MRIYEKGRNQGGTAAGEGQPRCGGGCLQSTIGNRIARLLVALLLVVMLVPAIPASQVEEAEALTGTTNYSALFTVAHRFGSPGYISGSSLCTSRTDSSSCYEHPNGKTSTFSSSTVFCGKKPVSLKSNWRLQASIEFRGFSMHSSADSLTNNMMAILSNGNTASNLNGIALTCETRKQKGGSRTSYLVLKDMVSSSGTPRDSKKTLSNSNSYDIQVDYTASNRQFTISQGSTSLSVACQLLL